MFESLRGKKKKENPVTDGVTGNGFEEAAARVGPSLGAEPESEQEKRFLVKQEWARGCVKLCFLPLERHDPLWKLTNEEAEAARPEMQAFLQGLLDRYVPQIIMQLAARNKEFSDLVCAMAALYWFKWRLVVAQKRKEVDDALQGIEDREAEGEKKFECEVCQKSFPSSEALSAHLPCSGPPAHDDLLR